MLSSAPAPIAFFTYNRPGHTSRSLASLAACHGASDSNLVIFSDAAKEEKDIEAVEAVRRVLTQAAGFRSVEVVARPHNLGSAGSIIDGVTTMLQRYDRAIFIEDDLVCSPHTLTFLNSCLERYADQPNVFTACAYNYPQSFGGKVSGYEFDAYFSPGFFPWGWASWRRTLDAVDWKVSDYTKFTSTSSAMRAFQRIAGDLPDLLALQQRGELDDWVLPLTFSQFKNNYVSVCPVYSLIDNIGHDGSGLHCAHTELFRNDLRLAKAHHTFPPFIYLDDRVYNRNELFHSQSLIHRGGRRILDRLLRISRKLRPRHDYRDAVLQSLVYREGKQG